MKKENPIDKAITAAVRCVKCGVGYGKCDCWSKCECGWLFEKGTTCNNPVHETPKEKRNQ